MSEGEDQSARFRCRQLLWREIDTSLAETWSDERLLRTAQGAMVANSWGVLAEICKRYERLVNHEDEDMEIIARLAKWEKS